MISENAAKKKICPIISSGNDLLTCEGSTCMGWRWSFKDDGRGFCVLISSQITLRNKKERQSDGESNSNAE